MKIYAPHYYKDFVCSAGECKHSCCALWQIEIDEDSYDKYMNLGGTLGKTLKRNINHNVAPTFKRDRKRRCLFLQKDGLCSLIINGGKEMLCNICAEHPRFYSVTSSRCEVGLGLCCEEACALALNSEQPFYIELIGNDEREELTPTADEENVRKMRDRVLEYLTDSTKTLREQVQKIVDEFSITDKINDLPYFLKVLKKLQRLDESFTKRVKRAIKKQGENKTADELHCRNFLCYLVYRHCLLAENEYDFSVRLAFCILSLRLACALDDGDFLETVRAYSSEVEYSEDNLSTMFAELAF